MQERLICPDCHLLYGVTIGLRNGRGIAICWLIQEGSIHGMKGIRKIAYNG
jgi:hypothetical protein